MPHPVQKKLIHKSRKKFENVNIWIHQNHSVKNIKAHTYRIIEV